MESAMKKLILLFALFLPFISSAQLVTGNLNITNAPVNSSTLIVNGRTFTWTNGTPVGPNAVLITNTLAGDGTNIFNVTGLVLPFIGVSTTLTNGTNLIFTGQQMAESITTNWASLVLTTNSNGQATNVIVPMATVDAAARTNIATYLTWDLNTNSTAAIDQTMTIASQLVGLGNVQTVTGAKAFTNVGGVFSGSVSNATKIGGTAWKITNGYYFSPTNFEAQMDTNTLTDTGVSFTVLNYGSDLSAGYQGFPFRIRWYGSDGVLHFDQGVDGIPSSISATFVGGGSQLTSLTPESILSGSITNALNITNIGNVYQGTISNSTLIGTNFINGIITGPRFVSALLANGQNQDVQLGTNMTTEFQGLTAAFTTAGFVNPIADRYAFALNSTVYNWTIENDSGFESTPARRIYTGTGASVVLSSNSWALFNYDSGVSRWRLVFASGTPSTGGSGTFSGTFVGNGGSLTNITSQSFTNYRAGFQAVGNLATSQAVTFSTPFLTTVGTNYSVAISSDSTLASAVGFSAGSKTTNGFTINLSAGVAGGIGVDYYAVPYQ